MSGCSGSACFAIRQWKLEHRSPPCFANPNAAVWIILVLRLFAESWAIPGTTFLTNERVLHDNGVRRGTRMIRWRTLRLFGEVSGVQSTDQISLPWRRTWGRPPVTWLQIIDGHCRELGLRGRAPVWHTCRTGPQEWRRNVAASKRCLDVCPFPLRSQ